MDYGSREAAERGEGVRLAAALVGRRIARVEAHAHSHPLDKVFGVGGVTLHLDDGTEATLFASWCNDETADLDVEVTRSHASPS